MLIAGNDRLAIPFSSASLRLLMKQLRRFSRSWVNNLLVQKFNDTLDQNLISAFIAASLKKEGISVLHTEIIQYNFFLPLPFSSSDLVV